MNNIKASVSTVNHKEQLAPGICKITFSTDECLFTCPGQYATIRIDGAMRPYQVCDYDSNRFTVVADDSVTGGRKLCSLELGEDVETVTGLGNGFDLETIPNDSWLVADSIGIPEMLELARCLLTRGKNFRAVLGYNSKDEIFMVDSFRNICNELEVLTIDGSNGREGKACDAVRNAGYVCASGTPELLKSLADKSENGQFSFSNTMAGIAADENNLKICTTGGGVRICAEDGPVFDKNEVNWDMV